MYQLISSILLLTLTTTWHCFYSLYVTPTQSSELYVIPSPFFNGNNSDGSFARPYLSLQQALDHVEHEFYRRDLAAERTTIYLYPTYYFVNTIEFTQTHSHTRLTTMNAIDADRFEKLAAQQHNHRRLTRATISGGVPITGWKQVSVNIYSAVVPSSAYVNQLFVNNQRIVRARVPTNFSDYLQYAAPINDSVQGRYGFQYQPGQFDYKTLADAMVVVYHSWTESHHYIDRLITENNTILFSNPSDRPIGTYVQQGQRRFHIENLCEALVPNSFCFVNETKTVTLMTDGSYDPTKVEMITPVNDIVMLLASDDAYNPVEDVIIDNVAIQHGAWNINRTQQADSASTGFLHNAAFFIANASSIVISDVEISHTGSYALWINSGTLNINFINSLITDIGAGGIWIGRTFTPMPHRATFVKILSNEISYGGNVFPSAVGIDVGASLDVIIADNSIHHHRYNGISVGNSLGYDPSGTENTIIRGNYFHDIGLHILNDQGGIYTIGVLRGMVIHGNVVKNVFSYAMLMWGIYLDEGSSDILVSNNIIYNTGWGSLFQHYGANNTIINNVFARASLNPPPQPGDDRPDGYVRIGLAENHTSWIFTRNIIYDTYQGSNHTVYRPTNGTIAPFTNNIYYNVYGAQLLFGYQQLSFADWQKTGQDNNSVVDDPLFAGDVNLCDFFTIRADSPAAKLGFVNLTKLPQWTPGCDVDDETIYTQFYHW